MYKQRIRGWKRDWMSVCLYVCVLYVHERLAMVSTNQILRHAVT